MQKISTKRIVFIALMAALTCIGSNIRVVMPIAIGDNAAFHLGNIFVPCPVSCWAPGPAALRQALAPSSTMCCSILPIFPNVGSPSSPRVLTA